VLVHGLGGTGTGIWRRQIADLEYLVGSRAAQTTLAENYAGFPLD